MLKEIGLAFRSLAALDMRGLFANRLVKMVIVGGIGFVIQFTIFEIIGIQLDLFSPATAALLGAEVSIVVNFILNNRFTFPEERIPFSRAMVPKFLKFNAAVVFSLATQWAMVSLGEHFANGNDWILRFSNILGVLLGFLMNYVSYTRLIWPKSEKDISEEKVVN